LLLVLQEPLLQETKRRTIAYYSIPGQGESVSGDQGSDEMLTFDLSIPILKRMITGSQSLYQKVQRDANWASRCQPSVNDQSLVLKRGSRIVVPDNNELQILLINELHDSMYAGHFGMARTRAAVGRMFWWESLDKVVIKFVSTCVACQRNKARHHKPYGLLQPLPVPVKPWHTVTFDFIVKLPKTIRGNDSVCVFVDKLTKMVHFVACKEALSAKEFGEPYVDHVFCLHGLSREFITDRDIRFTSAFWQGITELLGTRAVMSSSFHAQTDGQTERVNQTLESYLQHFVSVELNDWDTLLSRAEFAHNAAYHESIRSTPFKLNFDYHSRTPLGEVVEVVHPASAAFVERLQSSLRLARKLLIAAQQR
jgi:transposase InsO family protein